MMDSSRRKFIKNTSVMLAGLPAAPLISKANYISPNEKIIVALIGAHSMGFGDLDNALKQPGVECAAICDVDDAVLNKRIAEVTKRQGKAPRMYKDFRKLLEQKDIDAVIVGTPDHWHCLPTIYACQAGKDVYVEKPLANTIEECQIIVRAARKYNRVVQVGQQQRSGALWLQAMELIKRGKIGQLRQVRIWGNFNYGIGPRITPDTNVPAGVDYDMWLGPAPARPFNQARFHGSWRMFWDYGGGLMTDWGVHLLDMALWVKDIQDAPLAVMTAGGKWAYPGHAHETFDTMSVNYQMKEYDIIWQSTAGTQQGPYRRNYGLAYIGNDATLVIDRAGWELFPEVENGKPKVSPMSNNTGHDSHEEHMKNFLECIKTRKDPNCTVENGALVARYAHMGNISLKTRSLLIWDKIEKNFGDNETANALITPTYRLPWKLPRI